MTSSIETRLNEAKDAVVKAALDHWAHKVSEKRREALWDATERLSHLESEIERSKKPRLMPVEDRVSMGEPAAAYLPETPVMSVEAVRYLVILDRGQIFAEIEKLPRHMVMVAHYHDHGNGMGSGGIGQEPAILLSALRKLINGES